MIRPLLVSEPPKAIIETLIQFSPVSLYSKSYSRWRQPSCIDRNRLKSKVRGKKKAHADDKPNCINLLTNSSRILFGSLELGIWTLFVICYLMLEFF
ncbi:hypothetical protein D1BOALGB6SA_7953 [Olavius sp. associated proteobacterium Delta 1]|nr:hypothetical protein D1BOALGB6SA_7953 [Olavius sp. associated proteobacterium Delta 1]